VVDIGQNWEDYTTFSETERLHRSCVYCLQRLRQKRVQPTRIAGECEHVRGATRALGYGV